MGKGLEASGNVQIVNKYGLACQGWSPDGTAENANLGICFYTGPHVSPVVVWKLVWDFFGIPGVKDVQASAFSTFAPVAAMLICFGCCYRCCMRRRSPVKVSAD